MRHHLETIKGLAAEQNNHGVEEYVKVMEKLPELQKRVQFCKDPVLNAILIRCDEACREKKITFASDIRHCDMDVISPLDKTALFGNLLENAVEAADGSEGAFLELTLDCRQPQGTLVISLRNSCRESPEQHEEGALQSKKGTGHGIGMESMRQIVKKYSGQLLWQWDEPQRVFAVTITLPENQNTN